MRALRGRSAEGRAGCACHSKPNWPNFSTPSPEARCVARPPRANGRPDSPSWQPPAAVRPRRALTHRVGVHRLRPPMVLRAHESMDVSSEIAYIRCVQNSAHQNLPISRERCDTYSADMGQWPLPLLADAPAERTPCKTASLAASLPNRSLIGHWSRPIGLSSRKRRHACLNTKRREPRWPRRVQLLLMRAWPLRWMLQLPALVYPAHKLQPGGHNFYPAFELLRRLPTKSADMQ